MLQSPYMPLLERESPPQRESILGKDFVDVVLGAAQLNLAKDGELVPALFLRTQDDEQVVVVLENFPADSDSKQLYLTALGLALDSTGRHVAEALFLSEVWYVEAERGQRGPTVPPRQHPQRKEAIAIMGRNRQRSRLTHVLQPFQRDAQNQPVFAKEVLAEYNIPADNTPQAFGLVDYLFPASYG